MRIERLEIDGFGRFHDATWTFDEGFTILLGANEAGKTTLLNALRALLFGFEATRDGRTWYPALAGGRRGGRLVLRSRDGAWWTVERHGERGGAGALAVRAPNGNQGGQETLDRLLGGADRDLFTNIFAFGLGELQTFSSLSAEGVRGRIYGAGAGLGGTSAVDLERRLRQQLDAVFLPRGRERPLNQLLARIEELRGAVADLGRQPAEHAEAHRERATLTASASELREAVRAERERAARTARLLDARGPAAEVALLVDELADGDPALDLLPPDAVAVLERHVAALDAARATVTEVAQEVADATRDRERIRQDESILAAGDRILALREEQVARTGAADRRHQLEAAAARHAHAVDEQVARAGELDERRLVALDDSIVAVERTRELERQLVDARTRVSEADRRHRLLGEELAARDREAAPVDVGAVAADRLEALEALDALRLRRAVAEARGSTGPPAWLAPAAGALVLVATLLVGTVLGEPLIGAVGGVALGVGTALAVRFLDPASSSGLAELEVERRALLDRACLPLDADDVAVRRAAADLAADRARADLAADHRAAVEARRRQLEVAERELEVARGEVATAEGAWAAWLEAANLPDHLSPETSRQLLATAGVARRAAAERDEHRDRLGELASEEAGFADRIVELAQSLGAPRPADETARGAFLVGAVQRLEAARESERRSRDLDAAVERLTERRRAAESAADEAERRLSAFLAEVGCADPVELRRRDGEAAARRSAAARLRELRAQLAGMAGGAEAVDALVEAALAADPAELEASAADAREQVDRLEADERDVLNRIGALDARIEQLEHAEELGARRQELAALEGRAAALAREWAVRALALRLLEETRSRYERERQPDVVRAATAHFERITGGRYARVVAPPGEPGVRVETEGGVARTTDELSRGTAEQLYLALRFGLVEEFARSAEPLPVVMDDILVNFDAERAARAASAIRDLATRHQVLYFTCHRPIATLLDPEGDRTLVLD
jgi:uncharacterized protein YhaN